MTSTIGQRQWPSKQIRFTALSSVPALTTYKGAQITGTALCGIARTFERFGKRAVFYGQYRNKVTSLAYLDWTGRLDEASNACYPACTSQMNATGRNIFFFHSCQEYWRSLCFPLTALAFSRLSNSCKISSPVLVSARCGRASLAGWHPGVVKRIHAYLVRPFQIHIRFHFLNLPWKSSIIMEISNYAMNAKSAFNN